MNAPPRPSPFRQRSFSAAGAVFLTALLVRLWVLCAVSNTPDFLPEHGDMKFYSDWARRIAAGTWTDHQAFYGLPGYAYWLALVYGLFGFQPYVAVLFQIVAEAFTCMVIFKLAPLAFASETEPSMADTRRTRIIGWLAALGWMCFVPAQVYSTVLMPTAYLVAAFWSVVWWVLRRRSQRPGAGEFLLLGLGMGVIAMMIANILFLVPFVIAAIFLKTGWRPFAPRGRALAAGLLLTGVTVGASPCALHNYFLAHDWVPFSAHVGINTFLGNNPTANGYPDVPAPLHADQMGLLKDSILWAERAAGHPLKRSEVSAYWSSRAHRFVHDHPADWLRLEVRKLGNFWNGFVYDDLGVLSAWRADGVLVPGPGFGLVAAFGLPGLLLAAMRRPRARWIVAAVGLHMASLMTVFITERYRIAVVPGLLLCGSFGLVELGRELATRRWVPITAYTALLAAAVGIVHLPVDPRVHFIDDFNSSLADIDQNRLDLAQTKLERVLANNPDNAETNFALGNLWLAKGDKTRAKSFYRRTLEIDARHDRALNNLGVLAIEEKRWPLAEAFLRSSLQIDPDDAKTNYLLAQVRFERNDIDGAHGRPGRRDAAAARRHGVSEIQRPVGSPADQHPAVICLFPCPPCSIPRPPFPSRHTPKTMSSASAKKRRGCGSPRRSWRWRG